MLLGEHTLSNVTTNQLVYEIFVSCQEFSRNWDPSLKESLHGWWSYNDLEPLQKEKEVITHESLHDL